MMLKQIASDIARSVWAFAWVVIIIPIYVIFGLLCSFVDAVAEWRKGNFASAVRHATLKSWHFWVVVIYLVFYV